MIDVQELRFAYRAKEPKVLNGLTSASPVRFLACWAPGREKARCKKYSSGFCPIIGARPPCWGSTAIGSRVRFSIVSEWILEVPTLYERFTAMENLRFFESLYSRPCFRAGELLERLGLSQAANMRVSSFSKGMKSRSRLLPGPFLTTRICCFWTSLPAD